ncbi:MAG: PLP-dependent aminotransferase family protein [Mycobacteriales bacterium]
MSDMASMRGADFLQLDPRAVPARGLTVWLTDALRTAIGDGRLTAGAVLPATRELAGDLGISRGVVVEAYRRIADEGLVLGRRGAGTAVVPAPRPATAGTDAEPGRSRIAEPVNSLGPRLPLRTGSAGVDFDLSPGVPDLSAFPRAAWLRAERAVLADASRAELGYGDPRGSLRLREELARWLARTRGLRAPAADLLVVAGVAQALALLAQSLVRDGTPSVAVEDPGSRGARDELAYWGLRPVPVVVDAEGIDVAELAGVDVAAAALTPAHQFPTGAVLSPRRRRALLAWAAGGRLVIEDDYDAEYRYDRAPVAALHPSDPGHIAYAGSTSKTLAPALRIGWLIAPPDRQPGLIEAKHASDLGSPAVPQLVLAQLIASGAYERHIRLVRGRQLARRDALHTALVAELPGAQIQGVAAGLHLLLTFPDGLAGGGDDVDLAGRLLRAGVLAQPLSTHRHRAGPPGLVLGYAALAPDRLRAAARSLARVVRDGQKGSGS